MLDDELISALNRVESDQHTYDDIALIRRQIAQRGLTIATGCGAVSVGGDVTDTVIVTGDGNIVQIVKDATAAAALSAASLRRANPPDLTADMLLRGPLTELKLEQRLAAAESEADLELAARIYLEVEQFLIHADFPFHAKLVSQRRAEVLLQAGNIEEAYRIWLQDAISDLEAGTLYLSPKSMRSLDEHKDEVDASLTSRYFALSSIERWYEHPEGSVTALQESVQMLESLGDDWAPIMARWLGEMMLVDRITNEPRISQAIDVLERQSLLASESDRVRILLVLAEVQDNWASLLREATTGRLSTTDAALVLARRARCLAWIGEATDAIDDYRRAIEKLTQANLLGDASDVLLDITNLHYKFEFDFDAAAESHRLARTLRKGSRRFGWASDSRSSSLEAAHNNQLPDALRNARMYLWESIVAGKLTSEFDALEILGDVYARAGVADLSASYLVAAGSRKKIEAVFTDKSIAMDLRELLLRSTPWELNAGLSLIKAVGDRIPDHQVAKLAPRLIDLTQDIRFGRLSWPIQLGAWEAIASVAFQLEREPAAESLTLLDSFINHDPRRAKPMDLVVPKLLERLYFANPDLHDLIVDRVQGYFEIGSIAHNLRGFVARVIDRDIVLRQVVLELAGDGNRQAQEALAFGGITHFAVADEIERWESFILGMDPSVAPNTWRYPSGIDEAAAYVTSAGSSKLEQLARHLMALADAPSYPEEYRSAAALGVAHMAESISTEVRRQLFATAMQLTGPDVRLSHHDLMARDSLHPLSRFRLDFGIGGLLRSALLAAAHLATSDDEGEAVMDRVVQLFRGGDDQALRVASNVMLALDNTIRPQLDLRQLVSHPLEDVRAAAVVLWSEDPSYEPGLGQRFVSDSSMAVRLRLARRLQRLADHDPDLSKQLRGALRQDPSAAVRTAARIA